MLWEIISSQHVKMLEHSIRNINSPCYGLNCDSSAPCLIPGIFLMSSYTKIVPLPICHIGRTAVNETLGIVQITGLQIACLQSLLLTAQEKFFSFPQPNFLSLLLPFLEQFVLCSLLISLFLSLYIYYTAAPYPRKIKQNWTLLINTHFPSFSSSLL